jgi:hypothetical protein
VIIQLTDCEGSTYLEVNTASEAALFSDNIFQDRLHIHPTLIRATLYCEEEGLTHVTAAVGGTCSYILAYKLAANGHINC